jgi:hypothetical protein
VNGLPKTPEEFQLWMVEKVGDIHTKQADLLGELRVMTAKHDALEARVDVIVSDAKRALAEVIVNDAEHKALVARVNEIVSNAKSAKNWENGKILASFVVQSLLHVTRFIKP